MLVYEILAFEMWIERISGVFWSPDLPSEKFQNRSVCSQAVRIGHCRKRSTDALDRATKYKISIN